MYFSYILEIILQPESKVHEVKESIAGAGAVAKPTSTTTYNTLSSKYYKGRPIQSHSRTTRDGHLNTNYNNR